MAVKYKFSLLLIIFIIFNSCFAFAEEVGKITAVQGYVDILRAGKPPAVSAKINEPVYLKDIIRTKTDSKAEITFKDGTVVRVAPRSRVDISEYFSDAESFRVTLDVPRGKAGAFVSKESVEKIKVSPKANRFEIKTPIAVAGVRGTNYIVAHYPTYSTVTVITGKVYCYNPQFPEKVVEVTAGQMTVIKEQAPPTPPRRLTPKEIEREEREVVAGKEEAPKAEAPLKETVTVIPEKPPVTEPPKETITKTIIEKTPPITEKTETTSFLNMDVILQSIEPGSIYLNYKVQANRNITVRYRVRQNGSYSEWTTVNTVAQNPVYVSVPVLSGYSYQVEIEATDIYGHTKAWTSSTIYPNSDTFSGNIVTDTQASSSISGSVAGALSLNKGVAKLTVDNSVSFSSSFKAGGGNSESGYWLIKGPASSSYFRLLTPYYLFTGSGNSSLTLESGYIKSITTEPWIELKELNLSAKFTGYHHYYDSTNNKIDEVTGGEQSVVLIGRTGGLILPSNINETVTYNTENYGIGYIPSVMQDPSMVWGSFQQNSASSLKLEGYAGGIGEGSYQNYAIYGLYIGSDGSAGIIKGSPYGANQNLHEEIHILDIEPALIFKKKTTNYSTMNTWSNYIQGSYQGYFTGGGGTRNISQQNIYTTSQGSISSKTLSLKKGSEIEPWGVFGIELGGSHSATSPTGFKLEFGGDSWDNRDASSSTPDYWVGSVSNATVSNNKMSGTFNGKFITPTHYGTIEGKMLGDLGTNKWVGVVIGSYEPVIELSHLSNIVSDANTSKIYKHNFSDTGARINAYFGGNSFWTGGSGSLYSIGKINDSSNVIDFTTGYLWYAPITWSSGSLRYSGYAGGRFAQKSDSSYNMSAYIAGIYNDSTNKGIFIGNLSTDGASNVLQLEKRFFMEGENTVKAVILEEGSIPPSPSAEIISDLYADSNSYEITINKSDGRIYMDSSTNYKFGAGIIGIGGEYNTAPAGAFEITYTGKFEGGTDTFGALLKGDLWGTENNLQNVIKGKTYGYFADITGTPFVTGIFVGETVGTFDPISQTEKYWQTVTVGAALETAKFLSMACPSGNCNTSGTGFNDEQEKLRKLNIPVVEVGRANFSGTGNNLTVNMNNVVFFSTQSGQKPLLWATANVSGTYSGTPELNSSITLTGTAGSVNFTPTYWSDNKWAATIANNTAYPINLSGGSYNGQVNMKGAGAGTYTETQTGQGTLSGTAAGHCQ